MNGGRYGRMTIGLFNSYDTTRFREAHRRVLARAGPLALAFDANLALFGFPLPEELPTSAGIADWVASTTTIGENGSYLQRLASKGRLQSFPLPGKGFPPQLGEPVTTTSKPRASCRISGRQVAEILSEGRSILLVFGLGPHGLPKKVAEIARYDLDVTGVGFSLETCTALGAVVAAINAHLSQ
ncbi:MAG: uncharacterized protein PWQ62_177 [Candidatus Methanomethylophilaceae archaeon]|nr:uncharacterized protein [Candidatus Methanomethylophilaceae archaeon]